jgi:hypothetical protein
MYVCCCCWWWSGVDPGLLHLGIGRNEYIDLVHRGKALTRFGVWSLAARRKRVLSELLPSEPVAVRLEPWWIVCAAVPPTDPALEVLRVRNMCLYVTSWTGLTTACVCVCVCVCMWRGAGGVQDAPEEDVRTARQLHVERRVVAGELDWRAVRRLYRAGLVYMDVPIRTTDRVVGTAVGCVSVHVRVVVVDHPSLFLSHSPARVWGWGQCRPWKAL